jgi:hypothetical protein
MCNLYSETEGGTGGLAAIRFLKPDGRVIEPSPTIPVFIGSKIANLLRREKHEMLATVARRADLDQLIALVADGSLKPTIAAVYPLAQAKDAFVAAEKGGTVGKTLAASAVHASPTVRARQACSEKISRIHRRSQSASGHGKGPECHKNASRTGGRRITTSACSPLA